MAFDELVDSILTAKEEMLKHKVEANSVTLNGRRYGKLIENCPPNMKPTILGMTVKADYALPDDYDFLVQYEPPQPQTNADRIRSMTDEELAEWLDTITAKAQAYGYECADSCPNDCPLPENWLDWLKEEVTE